MPAKPRWLLAIPDAISQLERRIGQDANGARPRSVRGRLAAPTTADADVTRLVWLRQFEPRSKNSGEAITCPPPCVRRPSTIPVTGS